MQCLNRRTQLVEPRFFAAFLNSVYARESCRCDARHAVMPNYCKSKTSQFAVIPPPLDLQREFATRVLPLRR